MLGFPGIRHLIGIGIHRAWIDRGIIQAGGQPILTDQSGGMEKGGRDRLPDRKNRG